MPSKKTPKAPKKQITIESLDEETETVHISAKKLSAKSEAEPAFTPNPDHVLEFKVRNGKVFKDIFETMKNILNYSNFRFTEGGMRLQTVDEEQEILINLTMEKEYFQYYHCNPSLYDKEKDLLRIGLDIDKLQKIICICGTNWGMTWIVHKDRPGMLRIIMENPTKTSRVTDDLPTMHIESYDIDDNLDYGIPPKVNSVEFQKICKEMYKIGATKMEIKISNDLISFRNLQDGEDSNGIAARKWELHIDSLPTEDDAVPVVQEPVSGVFPLKLIRNFSKASNVSTWVNIYLEKGLPLVCEYELNEFGVLRYMLSPYPEEGDEELEAEQ